MLTLDLLSQIMITQPRQSKIEISPQIHKASMVS